MINNFITFFVAFLDIIVYSKYVNKGNGMKLIFCGPPGSGKTVFISNIVSKLPTDCYTIVRACPDGEGTWSNNKNQQEVNIVRRKGKFTKSFINNVCNSIDIQSNKLVLVDVGGIISKENEEIFKHCDNFIVLSNDEQKREEWLKFGQNLGLGCMGCIDSKLQDVEQIYSKEPYIKGKITGLDRGRFLENSIIMDNLVSNILDKINYLDGKQNNNDFLIDDSTLGEELGYRQRIYTNDGKSIDRVNWQTSAISKIYNSINTKVQGNKEIKINGIRANFILTSLCKALKNKGVEKISVFDTRFNEYIDIKNIAKKRGITKAKGLNYNLIENKENVFMHVDILSEQYTLQDYEKCILPKIDEKKSLFISGRLPLWLLASITNSYNSNKIFTFQPKNITIYKSKLVNL